MTATADDDRAAGNARLARGARGLSQAARADRAVPRLLRRAAAGAVRLDAAGLDARGRRRSRHHRPVRAGRHALHDQVPLGAGGRCARRAGAVAPARTPPRLAGALATPADRRRSCCSALRSGASPLAGRVRRAAGRRRLRDAGHRDRRLPRREPRRERAGRRHGVLCRGLPHRHAGLDRGRAVRRQRLRGVRLRQERRLDAGYVVMAALVADRHGDHADRDRAGTVGDGRPSAAHAGENPLKRVVEPRPRRVLGFPHPRDGDRRRWPSSCCSSSATPSPAR